MRLLLQVKDSPSESQGAASPPPSKEPSDASSESIAQAVASGQLVLK